MVKFQARDRVLPAILDHPPPRASVCEEDRYNCCRSNARRLRTQKKTSLTDTDNRVYSQRATSSSNRPDETTVYAPLSLVSPGGTAADAPSSATATPVQELQSGHGQAVNVSQCVLALTGWSPSARSCFPRDETPRTRRRRPRDGRPLRRRFRRTADRDPPAGARLPSRLSGRCKVRRHLLYSSDRNTVANYSIIGAHRRQLTTRDNNNNNNNDNKNRITRKVYACVRLHLGNVFSRRTASF